MGPSQASAISVEDIRNAREVRLDKLREEDPNTIFNLCIAEKVQKAEKTEVQ